MIVLDASVALKWFVRDEPLVDRAQRVLDAVEAAPHDYIVPEIFMAECLAVLSRLRGATKETVTEAMDCLATLGIERVALGRTLAAEAAAFSVDWGLSGYDAIYVALASLTGSVWLTADERAARKVKRKALVRLL